MSARHIPTQHWPKEPWEFRVVGTQPRLFDAKGKDITNNPAAHERLIGCVNGFQGVWLVAHHVEEAAKKADRLEQLRKDALARAEIAEAKVEAA